MLFDVEDGSFSVSVFRGFVRELKSVGLLTRQICFQTSSQFIVCIFSMMCTLLFLYRWRFIDPGSLRVFGQKGNCKS